MLPQGVDTLVFRHDTPEQRKALMEIVKPYWNAEDGLRVCAMSVDNEMRRLSLIEDALDRYSDGYDLREAVQAIIGCPDLSKFSWDDSTWTWMG